MWFLPLKRREKCNCIICVINQKSATIRTNRFKFILFVVCSSETQGKAKYIISLMGLISVHYIIKTMEITNKMQIKFLFLYFMLIHAYMFRPFWAIQGRFSSTILFHRGRWLSYCTWLS
jgi:hypothetical protein